MTNSEYYKKELKRVEKNIRALSVKFTGWEDSTKELNINLESIKEIRNFLNRIERKLKKESI